MSENSSALERNEVGNGTLGREAWEDMEDTPRSEIPVSVKVSTPTTVTEEAATHAASNSADGYFTIDPASKEQQEEQEKNRQNALSSRLSISDGATSHKEQVPEGGLTEHGAERPVPHSTISSASIQSVDSAATVRAANSAPASRSSIQHRPPFPNQSYAALHNQQYPSPRQTLKQRSSHPGQILTFASAVASQHQSGSRTVGNSPAQTPGVTGLFHPQPPPTLPTEWDSPVTPNTYASPFLHFTQRVPPKETHIADVDVDPISGRKLINHYEIVDELGRGTHGKVKLGRDLSTENTFVAIKIVERFSKRRKLGRLGTKEDKVKKEVAILKQARHPNVVGLLEVIDDPSRKKVYIVLEWVERGEIQWRAKGAKEVCTVEARRYEREKNATHDKRSDAEDAAVLAEAQKRLARQRRRRQKTFRLVRRETPHGADASTSIELGDDESDVSDDDRLSLKSAESSYNSKLVPAGDRRASRTPSPLPPRVADVSSHSSTEASTQYYSVTSEPQSTSPVAVKKETSDFDFSGLEGTMYGPYMSTSAEHSRVPSLHSATSSRPGSKASSDNLAQTAAEVLDSDLDPELEYVPVMTMQQARITFRDTLLGLQYLHYQGIVHRDIKPPNLLATSNYRVKISDFGVSYLGRPLPDGETGEDVSEHEARDLDDEAKELAKTVGTPAFYAPELCITEPTDDVLPITKAIDVWALGVTLFCILFARTPFVDNEFVVMRQIAEEEVYIPRKRLKPVEAKSSSRPSSHGRAFPPTPAGLRNELELSYEDIGDELYDLLKRMLIKDPRKRITLEEVRHHPWLVADLQDKINWLNETDPSRQSQGKKIEVSKEDVNAAVVPLQFLDRVRSGIRKVGERLGIGGKTTSRGRSRSNVHGSDGSPPNSSSPSTTSLGQDGRRHSLRSDESILTALKASREGEHPLSRSMAASPEFENFDQHSATGFQRSDPTLDKNVQSDHITPPRPNPPDRANTIMTTSGSMRTVRQSDFPERNGEESPPPSPGLPGTPTAVDSSGGIGGMARRIFRTVRERSTARSADGRASSSDRGSVGSLDTHGEPSLAVSQTMATGHVNPPASFDEFSPTSSAHNSPPGSRPISAMSSPSPGGRLSPSAAEPVNLSRTSSRGSTSSMRQRAVLHNTTLSMSPGGSRSPVGLQHHVPRESTPEEWQRAKDEHVRKLIRENNQEDLTSNAFDDRTCPPSPDDQKSKHSESRRVSALDISNTESSAETSPTGQGARLPAAVASSTSDFGSAVSMSVSNPSIPSVISEASSVDLADTVSQQEPHEKRDLMSSDETVHDRPVHEEVEAREEEYHADDQEDAFSSGGDNDYDSSSDSDGGLVMSRRRSNARAPRPKDAEGSDPQPQSKVRRDTGQSARSRKSSRSDSNNTMVKVHSQEEGQEDYQQTPLESNDS